MFNCKTSCPNKYIAGEEDRERLYILERECLGCVRGQLRGAEELLRRCLYYIDDVYYDVESTKLSEEINEVLGD